MPEPRLPRGASVRLLLFAALALAVGVAVIGLAPARADDAIPWPCGPMSGAAALAKALGGSDFVTLTNDQWQFLRGIFVMAPDTPASLPPGDHAAMSIHSDGSASVIFVDGDRACAPIKLGRQAIEVLMMVGRGDIVHAGQGL